MHLLILIAFSLSQFCWADQNELLYTMPSIDPESKEVFGIRCSNEELGALIRQQKPVVPSRIYHYDSPKAMNSPLRKRVLEPKK